MCCLIVERAERRSRQLAPQADYGQSEASVVTNQRPVIVSRDSRGNASSRDTGTDWDANCSAQMKSLSSLGESVSCALIGPDSEYWAVIGPEAPGPGQWRPAARQREVSGARAQTGPRITSAVAVNPAGRVESLELSWSLCCI